MWSLLLGLLIPVAYFGLLGVESYIDWSYRKTLQMPIAWPKTIYLYFFPPDSPVPLSLDTFDPTLFLFIVICNVAAYSLLAYVVLSAIAVGTKKRALPLGQQQTNRSHAD
jgi:hypothetical protein